MEEVDGRREARVKEEGKRGTKKKVLLGGRRKEMKRNMWVKGDDTVGDDMNEERKRERER